MTDEITMIELARTGTLSAKMAATLWAAVEQRLSFVVVAVPRFAGKSTVMQALLSLLPQDVPVHELGGDEGQMAELKHAAAGGYLVVPEFSEAPVPGYIWGEPVRRVFDTMEAGYSLATALHAPGVEEAIRAVCESNGVSDDAASRIDLVIYIERFGDAPESFWRRVTELYEVDRVVNGEPQGRTLFRWERSSDTFVEVERSRGIREDGLFRERTVAIEELAAAGKTSRSDLDELRTAHDRKV